MLDTYNCNLAKAKLLQSLFTDRNECSKRHLSSRAIPAIHATKSTEQRKIDIEEKNTADTANDPRAAERK